MGINSIFSLSDDILAGLDDDYSILVFQLGFFDLVISTLYISGRTI